MVPRVYIFYTCVTYSNSFFYKPCFSVRDIVVNLKELNQWILFFISSFVGKENTIISE